MFNVEEVQDKQVPVRQDQTKALNLTTIKITRTADLNDWSFSAITVMPIQTTQSFSTNFSKLTALAAEVYRYYKPDVKFLDQLIAREEVSYYATSLLWMKLLTVKAKQRTTVFTKQEAAIFDAIEGEVFNVPQPLFVYLSEIGTYIDGMGHETQLDIPDLPIQQVDGFGGYHATAINAESHNLFEEVPSLGIAGDMVMALTSLEGEPTPNFRVSIPDNTQYSVNLVGRFSPIGLRRVEIRQRLIGYGITTTSFPEYVSNTRFHLKYVKVLSNIIGNFETFSVEKVRFNSMSHLGGETQVIRTRPIVTQDPNAQWFHRTVEATLPSSSWTELHDAAYVFGFQLYKEIGAGADTTLKAQNWCCIERIPNDNAWVIPDEWVDKRNSRRILPPERETAKYRAISLCQSHILLSWVRRMIKTNR